MTSEGSRESNPSMVKATAFFSTKAVPLLLKEYGGYNVTQDLPDGHVITRNPEVAPTVGLAQCPLHKSLF